MRPAPSHLIFDGMTHPSSASPTRILVWDFPTRLSHVLLAAAVVGAFGIATLVDDEGAVFPWHMLLGAVAAFVVALRVIWGFAGSRYARFGSFTFGPREVFAYVKGIFSGKGARHVGHNPGSSVVIFAIFGLTLGLAATGVAMSRGGDVVKEIHEVLAYSLVGVIALHVAGVVVHTLRQHENIALAMLDGRKEGNAGQAIASAHPLVALALVGATALWAGVLVDGYDGRSHSVSLPGLGTSITLGEIEKGDRPRAGGAGHDDD